jgi:hypothetical protein
LLAFGGDHGAMPGGEGGGRHGAPPGSTGTPGPVLLPTRW